MKEKNCVYRVEATDDRLVILLSGEMDHHNAVAVRGEIDQLIRERMPMRVEIDLSGIGFMDSSGLGFVMGRYALATKMGMKFVLKNPNPVTVKIFSLAGLERMITIENDKNVSDKLNGEVEE